MVTATGAISGAPRRVFAPGGGVAEESDWSRAPALSTRARQAVYTPKLCCSADTRSRRVRLLREPMARDDGTRSLLSFGTVSGRITQAPQCYRLYYHRAVISGRLLEDPQNEIVRQAASSGLPLHVVPDPYLPLDGDDRDDSLSDSRLWLHDALRIDSSADSAFAKYRRIRAAHICKRATDVGLERT